jgi:hypothetical protein
MWIVQSKSHGPEFSALIDAELDAVWSLVDDTGGYYAAVNVETILQEVGQELLQHNLGGFEDRTASTLSWEGTAYTLTLTPTGTDYYWCSGVRYSYSSAKTCQIDDISGLHIVYFDGTSLTSIANPSESQFDDLITDKALVAAIYWNTNDDTYPVLADERHGVAMSGETHHWIHDNLGASYKSGGALSGYTLLTDSDAGVSFDVENLKFYDEDLEHEIENGGASTQYEQVLQGDAEIPVLYRDDVDGTWTEQAASTLPYIIAAANLAYNKDDGDGTWSQQELTNNQLMLYHLVLTNDWQYPVKMIQGTTSYTTLATARLGINTEVISWGNLPASEFILLYTFIMKTSSGFAGTKNCRIEEIEDLRAAGVSSGATYVPTDHGTLSGLTDDDHTQYVPVDGSRALTADWVNDSQFKIYINTIQAADDTGLSLLPNSGLKGIRMNNTGYVCIGGGTTNPFHALVISTGGAGGQRLIFQNDTTGHASTDGFLIGMNDSEHGLFWHYEAKDLIFGTSNTARLTIETTGQINLNNNDLQNPAAGHDLFTDFVADEHIDHTAVSVIAGAGLTGGGTLAADRTLTVVGGKGIGVAADSCYIDVTDTDWFLDEDDMASDSATHVASQQSIVAYVAAELAGAGTLPADPGFDAFLMWDDSASSWLAATLGDGLEFSGLTMKMANLYPNPSYSIGDAVVSSFIGVGGFVGVSDTLHSGVVLDNPNNTTYQVNIWQSNGTLSAYTGGAGGGATYIFGFTAAGVLNVALNPWVVDEDDMASDSATRVPTQQSVKAYVGWQNISRTGLSAGTTQYAYTWGSGFITIRIELIGVRPKVAEQLQFQLYVGAAYIAGTGYEWGMHIVSGAAGSVVSGGGANGTSWVRFNYTNADTTYGTFGHINIYNCYTASYRSGYTWQGASKRSDGHVEHITGGGICYTAGSCNGFKMTYNGQQIDAGEVHITALTQ